MQPPSHCACAQNRGTYVVRSVDIINLYDLHTYTFKLWGQMASLVSLRPLCANTGPGRRLLYMCCVFARQLCGFR